jgi:hypothetical protein
MKYFVILAILLGYSSQANAQVVCGDRKVYIETLKATHKEVTTSMGLNSNGNVIEVLVSPTGSWTLLSTSPKGKSCVLMYGEAWMNMPKQNISGPSIEG